MSNTQSNKSNSSSAYDLSHVEEPILRHIFAVIVDNEPGVLARVVGLFSGRGYNIESLTVTTICKDKQTSRITIVTSGTAMIIHQIRTQLLRLVPVQDVHDLSDEGAFVEKEIALIKVAAKEHQRRESLRIADIFDARAADTTLGSFVFQISGSPSKLDAFIELMNELGDVEVARSGTVAVARGSKVLTKYCNKQNSNN